LQGNETMKIAINQNALQTAIDPIIKSVLGLAAAASLVGVGYFGTQAFGRTPMYVVGGAMSTLGLVAQLAQSKAPKSNPQPQLVEVEEEEEAQQPTTKKKGKQSS